MRLRDSYDIPGEIAQADHSPAFSQFLWNWFGDTRALTHGEPDLSFLKDLTPAELELARSLIRRNLKLKQQHVIKAIPILHDELGAPLLREMLDRETDASWLLTIAGALWKLNRDPVFWECLQRAKARCPEVFQYSHLWQVLWVGDERALDFLIDLLDQKNWGVQSMTLGLLNELEFGRRMGIPARTMPHQPEYYRKVRRDPAFRERMISAIKCFLTFSLHSQRSWTSCRGTCFCR